MERTKRLFFRWGDAAAVGLVLMCALLLTAAGLGGRQTERTTVQVYQNGQLLRELQLDRDVSFEVEGAYRNAVAITDGAVRIRTSDCPTQDCVHSGPASRSGQVLVCLPNRLELRLVGGEQSVDVIVG